MASARWVSSLRGAWVAAPLGLLLSGGCEIRFGTGGPERPSCPCELPNAYTECAEGDCRVVRCWSGSGDCNGRDSDGCEASLHSTRHCGLCNNTCDASSCGQGICSNQASPLVPAQGSAYTPVVADAGHVYFAARREGVHILRAPKSGAAHAEVLAGATYVVALSVDDHDVYWLELSEQARTPEFSIRRVAKDGSSEASTLAVSAGVPDWGLIRIGTYFYLQTLQTRPRLIRVSVESGEIEPLPGWDRDGVFYSLQKRGENLVFGFSALGGESEHLIVEYQPASERFVILDQRFFSLSFTLDEENVYFYGLLESGPWDHPVMRRSIGSDEAEEIGRSRMPFSNMVLDGGTLFLIDADRGGLSRLTLADGNVRVLFGEQLGFASIALDERFIFFAGTGFVWRLPR